MHPKPLFHAGWRTVAVGQTKAGIWVKFASAPTCESVNTVGIAKTAANTVDAIVNIPDRVLNPAANGDAYNASKELMNGVLLGDAVVGAAKTGVGIMQDAQAAAKTASPDAAATAKVKTENNMQADDAQQYVNNRAPIEVPEVVIRQDNNFSSTVNDKGAPKAYIDNKGDLVASNPQGTGDIKSQVRGGNAQNSPLISTSDPVVAVEPKVYGNTEVVVETRQIQRDLNAGNLQKTTTEVIPPAEVQTSLQQNLQNAQTRFDNNPSRDNTRSLEKAKTDIANATRDGECLIRGCAPATYVSPPRPVSPPPVTRPSLPLVPVTIPAQAEPKSE